MRGYIARRNLSRHTQRELRPQEPRSSYNLCIHVIVKFGRFLFTRKINYIQKKTNFRNTLIPFYASVFPPFFSHRSLIFGLSLNPFLSLAFASRYLYLLLCVLSVCLFCAVSHRKKVCNFNFSELLCLPSVRKSGSMFMPYAFINRFMLMENRQHRLRSTSLDLSLSFLRRLDFMCTLYNNSRE